MKAKKKSFLLLLLALLLVFTTIVPVSAEETKKPGVTFEVSEPDSNGYFTASFKIKNAVFNGVQVGLGFDKDVVRLVSFADGKETSKFADARKLNSIETENETIQFSEIGCVVSNEEGKLKFSDFIMPGANGVIKANIDDDEFVMYEFRFKRLKTQDPNFDLLDYSSAKYEKELILSGGEDLGIDFQIIVPESFGKDVSKSYDFGIGRAEVPEPPLPEKQQRDLRRKDSIILSIDNYVATVDGALRWLDENNKNVYPYIENDRTYVPLRFIGESMGAQVNWDAETAAITVNLGENNVIMTVGKTAYFINGEQKEMDVTPVIKEDRTFVPIKFVSEALSKSVYWNANSRVVIVTPVDRPWDENNEVEKKFLSDCLLIMSPMIRDMVTAK